MIGETEDTRAITDLLGFVLTFAIIVSAVSFVYFAGFDALGDLQSAEQDNSADRGMRGVATTLEDINRRGAPARSIRLGVDDGTLQRVDSELRFVIGDGSGTTIDAFTIRTGALTLRRSESSAVLGYESGAMFRTVDGGGSRIRHRPAFWCSGETAVISVLRLEGDFDATGSQSLVATRDRSRLVYPDNTVGQRAAEAGSVSIDVSNSRFSGAWGSYFERIAGGNAGWVDPNPSTRGDRTFSCDGIDEVYVRETVVELRRGT